MFFLTGCTTTKPDTSRTSSTLVSCSGKYKCPLSEEKKKGIVSKLRESGDPKARELADAIENGDYELYELNDAARAKLKVSKRTGGALNRVQGRRGIEYEIFVDPNRHDAGAAAVTAHEYSHILSFKKGMPYATDAQKLLHERRAFNLGADVWEALKKNTPSLTDPYDDIVNHRNNGTLDRAIIETYGLKL